MKRILLILIFIAPLVAHSQSYKQQISVVQYSAPFVIDKEISLKEFEKKHSVYLFYMDKDADKFKKDKIVYVPTLVIFHNGEEYYRIDGGIKLDLPENTTDIIQDKIEEIIESKFE